jgi:Flp pilus assembly protein TadG
MRGLISVLNRLNRALRGSEGQDLVEFALVVPILLLLLFGILEMGRLVFTYNTLANAAREGARFGIVHPSSAGAGTCAAAPAGIATAACALTTGLMPAQVQVTPTVNTQAVRVQVDYPMTLVAGPVISAIGGSPTVNLRAVAQMQREQ